MLNKQHRNSLDQIPLSYKMSYPCCRKLCIKFFSIKNYQNTQILSNILCLLLKNNLSLMQYNYSSSIKTVHQQNRFSLCSLSHWVWKIHNFQSWLFKKTKQKHNVRAPRYIPSWWYVARLITDITLPLVYIARYFKNIKIHSLHANDCRRQLCYLNIITSLKLTELLTSDPFSSYNHLIKTKEKNNNNPSSIITYFFYM